MQAQMSTKRENSALQEEEEGWDTKGGRLSGKSTVQGAQNTKLKPKRRELSTTGKERWVDIKRSA